MYIDDAELRNHIMLNLYEEYYNVAENLEDKFNDNI